MAQAKPATKKPAPHVATIEAKVLTALAGVCRQDGAKVPREAQVIHLRRVRPSDAVGDHRTTYTCAEATDGRAVVQAEIPILLGRDVMVSRRDAKRLEPKEEAEIEGLKLTSPFRVDLLDPRGKRKQDFEYPDLDAPVAAADKAKNVFTVRTAELATVASAMAGLGVKEVAIVVPGRRGEPVLFHGIGGGVQNAKVKGALLPEPLFDEDEDDPSGGETLPGMGGEE